MTRVIIFIDGSNFYHLCNDSLGTNNIEFGAFCKKLCDGRDLVQIRYYNAAQKQQTAPVAYKNQQKFFARIRKIEKLVIILGKLKKRGIKCPICQDLIKTCPLCKHIIFNLVEKNTDVNFAIDVVRLAYEDEYDVGILVTGDGDFSGAVKLGQKIGKKFEHARFGFGYSSELNSICDTTILLTPEYFTDCYLSY